MRTYLIDPNVLEQTVSIVNDGLVMYSGYLYGDNGKDLTVEEYKKVRNVPHLVEITDEELDDLGSEIMAKVDVPGQTLSNWWVRIV